MGAVHVEFACVHDSRHCSDHRLNMIKLNTWMPLAGLPGHCGAPLAPSCVASCQCPHLDIYCISFEGSETEQKKNSWMLLMWGQINALLESCLVHSWTLDFSLSWICIGSPPGCIIVIRNMFWKSARLLTQVFVSKYDWYLDLWLYQTCLGH